MDGFDWGYLIGAAIGVAAASVVYLRDWRMACNERDRWREQCDDAEAERDRLRFRCERAEDELERLKGAKLELYALRERIEDAIEACGSGEKQ